MEYDNNLFTMSKYASSEELYMAKADHYKKLYIKMRDMLFKHGAMSDAPCFVCGYNGQNYYNPDVHECAELHHKFCK